MKQRKKEKFKILTLLIISLLINIGMSIHIGYHHTHPDYVVKTEIKVDTFIETKYETDTIIIPDTLYKYKTIVINDTTYIERHYNDYIFNDDYYTLFINAVDLNKYKLDIHKTDTIRFTKQVEVPIYVKPKEKHWYYGIGMGVGYGLFNKKPDIYIGISAGYKF